MGKFITFGEIMLRLSPSEYQRFLQAKNFEIFYGGAESNVSVSLANFGKQSYFVTKLPKNEIGDSAVQELKKHSVNTKYIVRGGERIGIYFCEKGVSQRPSKVIYDRTNSSISSAKKHDFNWKEIFEGAEWFHFTGITPALSDACAEIILEAVKTAKDKKVTVSVDVNYRKKLWSREKAEKVMSEIVKHCDIIIANEEDAEMVFGIKADKTDIIKGKISNEGYKKVAKKLIKRFSNLKYVAITLRESLSASDNNWSGMLYDRNFFYISRKYNIHIVDRIGAGDAFAGGLIYGLTSGFDNQTALEFAVASSCLKHTIEGDFNLVSKEEVESLLKGNISGRVQR